MGMQGSLLISPHKFVDLDPERRDRFGTSASANPPHYEDNDVAMAQDMWKPVKRSFDPLGERSFALPEPSPETNCKLTRTTGWEQCAWGRMQRNRW
jgi:hypothetical protein